MFFVGGTTNNRTLYSILAGGSNLAEIPTRQMTAAPPAITPDGRQITYASSCQPPETIVTMDNDGSHPLRYFNQPGAQDVAGLVWSAPAAPRGEARLAFTGPLDFDGEATLFLTAPMYSTFYPTPSAIAYAQPSWSPDGQRVVFVVTTEEATTLSITEVDRVRRCS